MHLNSTRRQALPDHPHALAASIAAFTLLRLTLAASLPLLPQEAYYWQWSLRPDWSYFDHPPLAAWSIALSTALFGQTAFGIKAAAVAWSLGWNLLWARLVLDLFADRCLALWSLLAINLTIVHEALGTAPTPDTPLLFAWVGALWALWRASTAGRLRWWLATGVFAGLGLLAKYSAVLLLPIALLFLALSPTQRHRLRHPGPYLALLIAALLFTPVLWWNAQHDWASFSFQGSRRLGQMAAFEPRHTLMLLGTQLLVVTPYLFVLTLAALGQGVADGWRGRLTDATRLLLIAGAVPLLVFAAVSLRSVVKANWPAPAYAPLIVLALHQWLARGAPAPGRKLAGLASSAVLMLVMSALMLVPNLPLGNFNTWSGWPAAADRVHALRAEVEQRGQISFIFAPNYKTSSLMRFHLPGQPRTYAQDIYGVRALQYDHWPLREDLAGATGLLVLTDQRQSRLDLELLAPWFDAVEFVEAVETRTGGRLVRRVEIWRGLNYRGHPRTLGLAGSTPGAEDGE